MTQNRRPFNGTASTSSDLLSGLDRRSVLRAPTALPGGVRQARRLIELARRREIKAVLVTELSRWGRSTADLVGTLDNLHGWGVSVLALNGQSFDLSTATGKMMRSIMAALAEFGGT